MQERIVIKPGSPVEIGDGNDPVPATVTEVIIVEHSVSYRVVWWNGRDRIEEYLTSNEVRQVGRTRQETIGFR